MPCDCSEGKAEVLKLDDLTDEKKNDKNGCEYTVKLFVCEALKDKHPASRKFSKSAVSPMTQELSDTAFHPFFFDSADFDCVRQCVLNTFGSAGPSGADALHWRRLCTAFGEKSNSLSEALSMKSRQLATAVTDPQRAQALNAFRLIGLDKNLGVRPFNRRNCTQNIFQEHTSYHLV